MVSKSLGDILVAQGALSQEQLEAAAQNAAVHHLRLDLFLSQQKLVTPDSLAHAYATLLQIPYIEAITDKMADPALLAKVPFKFLRDNQVIPVVEGGKRLVVSADPTNFQATDDLNIIFNGELGLAVATPQTVTEAINRYYPIEGTKEMIAGLEEDKDLDESLDFSQVDEGEIVGMESEAPIIKLVNHILYRAAKRGASDIHIEPGEKELTVRYRIDGIMYVVLNPPKRIQGALISRIKIMASLNIAEKRVPQDGRIQIKVADKPYDIRVSILPVNFGERVVMRLLDKSKTFVSLQQMGFSERDYKTIMQSVERPNGIVMVSGPTGSGKTSTLYSILNKINSPEINIITVEDPVEYQMPGVAQVQVKEKIGLTFAAALRSILRQDPDVVMIGETRDQETAQIAIQAALTGHLVLTTIHTNNAPATITRLLDMGIEPFLIASSLVSVTAQRLVRRLHSCKKAYSPSPEVLTSLGLDVARSQGLTFYEPVGCEECLNTGYKGRLALFEIMVMTNAMARLTMERADTSRLRKQALDDGMTELLDDGITKIKEGLTSVDEVLAVAAVEEDPERNA